MQQLRNFSGTRGPRVVLMSAFSVAVLTPTAIAVRSVTMSSPVLAGGATATATVTLDAPSPSPGTSVVLSSSRPGVATVPAKVGVQARARSATFTVTAVSGNGGCSTISANVANTIGAQSALISVRPTNAPGPITVSLAKDTVVGGASVQGSVVAAQSAGSGTVQLSSSNPAVIVPASVSVTTAVELGFVGTFTVTTSLVQFPGTCSVITATRGSSQNRVLLRIMPLVQG